MARKLVLGIFISFCFVLLMSHNTFAVEYSTGVRYSGKLSGNSLYWQDNNDGSTWRNSGYKNYGRNNTHSSALYFRFSNSNRTFIAGPNTIFSITGSFYSTSAVGGSSNTSGAIYAGPENLNCMIEDLDIDTVQVENISSGQELTYYNTFTLICRTNQQTSGSIAVNLRLETLGQYGADYTGISFSNLYYWVPDTSLHDIYLWLQNNSDDAGDTLKQEKQDVQDAADNSEASGESSSQDAEAGTASLISAIGSAVSVISSASPTNCRINGDMGNLDVGQIDLCANPVPAFVQVIGSLILILITVPFCITLFNRFISLFRSFQG